MVATDWGNMVGTLEATANGAVEIDWGQWNTAWTGGLWTKVTLIHGGYGYPVDGYPPPTPAPTPTPTPTPAVATGDAGFEQVQVGYGRFQYRPSGSPWTFTGGAGISGNDSGFTAGNPPAPQGVQVAFIQGTGAMSQTVEGWAAGTYALTFYAAQRGNSGTSMEDLQVLIDGVPVGTFNPSGTSYQSYSTVAFTVTAGAHTIVFQGLDTAGGDNTAFVDAVAVMQATPSLVADPGFDQVVVGYSRFQYRPPGSPWTFTGGAGISGNNSGFTGSNPPAPQFVQVAFLQGTGAFSQAVAGWAAGSYTLSFSAAQRGNHRRPGRTSRSWSTGRWWTRSRPRARRTDPIPPPRSRSPPGRTRSPSGA